MALKISYRVTSNANLIKKGKERLRAKVPVIAKKRFKIAAQELKTRMSQPGRSIRYPVNWVNDKQRIAVIIKLKGSRRAQRKAGGFKNLPYKRTGNHSKGWKMKELKLGFSVYNSKGTAIHVFGDAQGEGQSPIHQNRWPVFRRQADIVLRGLPKIVREEMAKIAKEMPKK